VELKYYGANCVRINTKGASIIVDDNLAKLGLKSITRPTDIALRTSSLIPSDGEQFSADMPGEYEVADVVIHGVAARGHMEEEGKLGATIFTVAANDLKVAIIGHIYPELSEDQLEQIGLVDVIVIPVGGNGYTLDGTGALQIIKKIEPKVVIPTHYADKALQYEVPQAELADALKSLSMEPSETLDKYKPKAGEISDMSHLIILERQ
jgi:L-ascorbate metabolism protein UlaG (beta-lactamase superfamily)